MGTPPKLSIVTPSYNQAAFIAETIESVLSQAGEFEIEYFVMDGGSTDGSVEIIKSYADRVATGKWQVQCVGVSMSWVSQRDNGQSDAINQGLRQATGNILGYINSDDLYHPGAFAHVADEFASHPEADFVYGDGDVIDAVGNVQWEWLSRPYNHSVMTSYHFLWDDFTNYIMQQATFWRRNVVGKIGYFDETFHYALDVEYWIRAGHNGLKLHHTPHKLGKFRLIPGTKSLSSPTVFWEDYLEIYRRYRGSRALGTYFACYYRSLARQFDFDLAQTMEKTQQVFIRWQTLPGLEQQIIAQQAERGFALACLLLANELHCRQRYEEAKLIFKRGLAHRPYLALHPFALMYFINRAGGKSRLSLIADTWRQRLILAYRRVRYDYRYYRK
jgi:glycosyltransferase involved in cell wall biosynthesis